MVVEAEVAVAHGGEGVDRIAFANEDSFSVLSIIAHALGGSGEGSDTLAAFAGRLILTEGSSTDLFHPSAGNAPITNFTCGQDQLAFIGRDFIGIDTNGSGIVEQGDSGVMIHTVTLFGFTGLAAADFRASLELQPSTAEGLKVLCGFGASRTGSDVNDMPSGTDRDDMLAGPGGADVEGMGSNDILIGGRRDDLPTRRPW